MPKDSPNPRPTDAAAILLGYLNFSSGAFDASVWGAANELFAAVEPAAADGSIVEAADAAERVWRGLTLRLDALAATEPAFRDSAQARGVLDLVFRRLLPAYRRFHADLLEHQAPGALERPYFLMAAVQAVLAGDGWRDDADDAVRRAIATLNDYVGWRPVAVLENGRLSEPYPHERVRPIPLFVAGAAAAHGRYRGLVDDAIGILSRAPEPLLRQADFDLALLEELACDPRAFDFLHPAASRPNYLFGLWDPARIDGQGFYRRMVVQQATLDGILSWPEAALATADDRGLERRAELRRESAAVLAGVMLMASGLSGHGPGALAAGLPLADLLPRIAGYRDEFYRWLLAELPATHRARLDEENSRLRQPFGGVRRHINSLLAGRRARQVESVSLAATLARLGRAEAAERLVGTVPAASARMAARITSRVVAARRALRRAERTGAKDAASKEEAATQALDHLDAARALFLRAVDCGAVVDPWNILGLGGQFPLHEPGGESLADPRVDDLVAIAGSILDGYAGVWRQAALEGPPAAAARAAAGLDGLAGWWDQFATTTVSGVPHLSGRETCDSAREVIESLTLRRRTAPAAPPPGFWREQVASFTSPKAHAQATDCLLHEDDLDGALGLLVHWASLLEGPAIGRSGPVWLGEAERWLARALADRSPAGRNRVRRFVELVEANTAGVADVIGGAASGREPGDRRPPGRSRDDAAGGDALDGLDDEAADGGESVAAAYESMVWRDSTDDGVDGGMLDLDGGGAATGGGVAAIEEAAEFLAGVFGLMRRAVVSWCAASAPPAAADAPPPAEVESVIGWRHSLRRLERTLVRAAAAVAGRDATPSPGMTPTEFDKLRWQRDAAAEQLVEAAVQARETLWMLAAHLHGARRAAATGRRGTGTARRGKGSVGRLFAAMFAGDAAATRRLLAQVRGRLDGRFVLYVPLSRGGRPDRVVPARGRERLLERLAACLPRLGLVAEAADIVLLAKALETRRPRGPASVSEFDRVFEAATTALVERIVETAGSGSPPPAPQVVTDRILDGLSLLVPRLLDTWTTHARQLRLSVLERVRDDKAFAPIREFVETYGSGLFTQQLLSPPALRGILRGGVRHFLEDLVDRAAGEPDAADPGPPSESPRVQRRPVRLIEDLSNGSLPLRAAAARLRLVLESVAENHAEYRDWNSTTTQSDRGECLHMLLEFLRIKAEHDRIAWTLRPVNMAHRVLARRGVTEAAEAWRGRMRDETRDTAAGLAERLAALEAQSGVRLASVGDRVRRPFTTALEQDGLESLVEPAVAELFTGEPAGAGDRLETRAESFLGVVGGSGVEVPGWLERLGVAVDRAIERSAAGIAGEPEGRLPEALPWAPLPWETLRAALEK